MRFPAFPFGGPLGGLFRGLFRGPSPGPSPGPLPAPAAALAGLAVAVLFAFPAFPVGAAGAEAETGQGSAGAAAGGGLPAALSARMRAAEVVVLGEVHDNPAHHAVQAAAIGALAPKAVVWEMLTAETAARINALALPPAERVERILALGAADWPGFAIYRPVVAAAAGLPFHGGLVPRRLARQAAERGVAALFGGDAARYGLTVPLPPDEQAAREAAQAEAHCNALPDGLLPLMVDIQRLRDAVLARAVLAALDRHGVPVVVITGNGHARTDRGMPAVLRRVRPELRVFALGQSEDGRIEGRFDAVLDAPAAERPDPCAAFAGTG